MSSLCKCIFLLLFLFEDVTSTGKTEYSNNTEVYPKKENITSTSTEPITTTKPTSWYTEALREIAYYLRLYKFNEYDRRYETNAQTAPRHYFRFFPKPPLRSLHWEVRKFCEPSFDECVSYIQKKIKQTGIRRQDDTSVVMQELNWTLVDNSQQVYQVDDECKKSQRIDDRNAYPFEGPIERFQWRTTASYFMCMYTMKNEPKLKHLSDNCDNFASCLDMSFGPKHHDPRSDDSNPFSCAMYSFCPDPCCPQKHLDRLETCWESPDNPCYEENSPGHRHCFVNRSENINFRDIVLNRWNVTCKCPQKGFRWSSLYGICVDVDECTAAIHNCEPETEACVNLKGSFKCACKWGHGWDLKAKKCTPSPALAVIKLHRNQTENKTEESKNLLQKLLGIFRSTGACNNVNSVILLAALILISAEPHRAAALYFV